MTFANRSRIEQTVEALAQFNATPGAGITRLSYTAEYRAAQAYLKQELEAAGLSVRLDPMGNLIGRKEGTDRSLAAIAVGSHLDSVRKFIAFVSRILIGNLQPVQDAHGIGLYFLLAHNHSSCRMCMPRNVRISLTAHMHKGACSCG